jgi:putative membrane protein insertion efficiency factor
LPRGTWRRFAAGALTVGVAVLLVDLERSPDRQITSEVAVRSIHLYQRFLARPLTLVSGSECRLIPSCSRYAEAAIRHDGLLKGGGRTLARIVRCGPWTPPGTVDLPFDGYRVAASSSR